MRTPSSDVGIGTPGWSYPSGKGTWNGVFYPKPRSRDFDELAYYAEHFDTVEVNSTFYGQPRADVCRRWAERTPSGFEFSVKLYQKFTHPRMFGERVAKQIGTEVAGNLGPADTYSDAIAALAGFNQADLDEFRRGIEPIATAAQIVERFDRRYADAAERLQGRVGPDQRAEVPLLDSSELPAERQRLLLHAAARAKRRQLVETR